MSRPVQPLYWVHPVAGVYQHATLSEPPAEGGEVETIGDHPVEAPPASDGRRGAREICPDCQEAYLSLHPVQPRWKW